MILVLKSGSIVLFWTFEFYTFVRDRDVGEHKLGSPLSFFFCNSSHDHLWSSRSSHMKFTCVWPVLSAYFGFGKQDHLKCLRKARTIQDVLSVTTTSNLALSREVYFGHSCLEVLLQQLCQCGTVHSLLFLLMW